MLADVAERLGVTLRDSFVVGDRWRDVEAGKRAGCTTILLAKPYQMAGAARGLNRRKGVPVTSRSHEQCLPTISKQGGGGSEICRKKAEGEHPGPQIRTNSKVAAKNAS